MRFTLLGHVLLYCGAWAPQLQSLPPDLRPWEPNQLVGQVCWADETHSSKELVVSCCSHRIICMGRKNNLPSSNYLNSLTSSTPAPLNYTCICPPILVSPPLWFSCSSIKGKATEQYTSKDLFPKIISWFLQKVTLPLFWRENEPNLAELQVWRETL